MTDDDEIEGLRREAADLRVRYARLLAERREERRAVRAERATSADWPRRDDAGG